MTKHHVYQLITYLNASHAIRWENGEGQAHPHTYEIKYQFHRRGNQLIRFDQVEKAVATILDPLNGAFLNKVAPFDHVNPTLENLTNYLFDQFNQTLAKLDCQLESVQVSESPTRAFRIESRE